MIDRSYRLPLAVPGADAVATVDHVQPDGERVDDLGGETALRFHLVRAQRHLGSEVLRQLGRGDQRGEEARHDDDDVVRDPLVAPRGNDHFERAEQLVLVDQGQPHDRTARDALALHPAPHPLGDGWPVPRELGFVAGARHGGVAGPVRRAQPEAAATQVQAAPQGADDPVQGLARCEARLEHRCHFSDDPDTGMLGIEGGNDHRALT